MKKEALSVGQYMNGVFIPGNHQLSKGGFAKDDKPYTIPEKEFDGCFD